MIAIAICEDDIDTAEDICQKIEIFAKEANVSVEIEVFGDGRDIVADILYGNQYDLIFMDIKMRHMDGMIAAQKIRAIDKAVLFIYITSYSGYAVEAYAVHPFQFLVKPYKQEVLKNYFLGAVNQIIEEDSYFRYSVNKKSYKVLMQDILYFESRGRTIFIVSKSGVYKFNSKLNSIDKTLASSKIEFWRIHQSYLVSRKHIYKIAYTEVKMSNDVSLPISEERRKGIRGKYFDKIGAGIIELF